uniref:Histidine-containing phosphotransfer protein n=1 Tax=Aegilops tauschii subsp. strangulata TaxID=200361 RepID=A0A453FF29_AEGTS
MQQLKGSCSSIGASRMKNECMSFRDNCGQRSVEGLHGVSPETEEGACHPEAETRILFPAAATSWSCWSGH